MNLKILRCFFCSGFFTLNIDKLYEHVNQVHKCKNYCRTGFHSTSVQCNSIPNRTFKCSACTHVAYTCAELFEHCKIHKCSICQNITCNHVRTSNLPTAAKRRRLVSYTSSEESEEHDSDSTPEALDDLDAPSLRSRTCPRCQTSYLTARELQAHYRQEHSDYFSQFSIQQVGSGTDDIDIRMSMNALDSTYIDYTCDLSQFETINVDTLFSKINTQLATLLESALNEKGNYKLQFVIDVHFYKLDKNFDPNSNENDSIFGEVRNIFPSFNGFLLEINNVHDIPFVITKNIQIFRERIEQFMNLESGFIFKTIRKLTISLADFEPISAGFGMHFVLPQALYRKNNVLINVAGNDSFCFKRAVYAHPEFSGHLTLGMDTRARKQNLENLEFYDAIVNDGRVDWTGITFPFSLRQVRTFEKNNPSISLCIIGYDEKKSDFPRSKYINPFNPNSTVDQIIESVVSVANDDSDDEPNAQTRNYSKEYNSRLELQKQIRSCCSLLYTCDERRKIQVDIMLLFTNEGNHYINIKNLHGLLVKPARATSETCRYCLHNFSRYVYPVHVQYCSKLGCQKTVFPKDKYLRFKAYKRTNFIPYLVFADFESNMKNLVTTETVVDLIENPTDSNNVKVHEHEAVGYAFVSVDKDGDIYKKAVYRAREQNENVARRLVRQLAELAEEIEEINEEHEREAKKHMELSADDLRNLADPNYAATQKCFFCQGKFYPGQVIVREHSHTPPYEFRGLAHASPCNLISQLPKKELVVIMHNLKGYDSKLILEAVETGHVDDIQVVASSSENFMSMTIKVKEFSLKFIDSYMFLNSSLETLVNEMCKDTDFNVTRQAFEYLGSDVKYLLGKGLYPYSYMTSIDKFKETEFPDAEHFRNDLSEEEVTLDDYYHGLGTWHTLRINDLGEWHDTYCMSDCTILADSFLRLRGVMFKAFGLDIAWYLSLPMFAYDALLKMTNVYIENITDPTMFTWLESAIRGGLVSVGEIRAFKSNNPFLPPGEYDPDKPTTYISYFDINNQYGKSLSEHLPVSNFKWVTGEKLQRLQNLKEKYINEMSDTAPTGMFIECDIEVPADKHSYLNAYPPMPYKRCVDPEEVSEWMKEFGGDLGVNPSVFKTERLITDLLPKKQYVCHYRALKYWIKLGCKIVNIRRAVSFKQTQWLKPFIDYNTAQRRKAISAIEILFWKLLNCFSFGKFIENKRKRQNFRLIMSREKGLEYNRKPTIQSIKILRENLVLITLKRLQVKLDRPIICGVACLELSKLQTYKFHYDYMVNRYGNRQHLIYSDTDSLCYGVETANIYQDCKDNELKYFDMSDYDPKNPVFGQYHSNTNKKVLGMLKDEFSNKVITHMVVNKPKMYVCRYVECKIDPETKETTYTVGDKKKAKGVARVALKKRTRFEDYVDSIVLPVQTYAENTCIRSFKQKLYTVEVRKRALNGFDIKRHILADRINTLAFGHTDIPLYEN